MKRIISVIISPIILIMIAVVVWTGSEIIHARSSNAGGIESYSEYREKMPEPVAARILNKDGVTFYATFGPIYPPIALPSGPPVYIFDSKGNLVDWTLDSGEDPKFLTAWTDFQGQSLEIIDVDTFFKRNE